MVEYYPITPEDYTKHGITLHPTTCEVTWQGGSRYDLEMEIPMNREGFLHQEIELLTYGAIVYASVPPQHIDAIDLGPIYVWQVKSGQSAPLLKSFPYSVRVTYQSWVPAISYTTGEKVTYDNQNYQCTAGHGGISTPPPQNPSLWTTISNYGTMPGTTLETLSAGTQFYKLGDYNTSYMRAQHGDNIGYIEIAKCEYASVQEERTIPARDITHQPFRITEIEKDSEKKVCTVHAVHLSYLLNGMLLDECDLIQADPQLALFTIYSAMMEPWPGIFATSITAGTITQDFTNRMAGDVLLNPSNGFIQAVNGRLIRDEQDIIILPNNTSGSPVYELTYGSNLLGVTWTLNIDDIVTRIYPVAKNSDDTTLMLPEKYIESDQAHDWDVMELLDTGLKVGEKETATDGTETTLTLADVQDRMRTAANNRFSVDRCDIPVISLDVNFINLGDTEEYSQFKGLATVAPYDWVAVTHGPMGITATVQLIGYVWDSVNDRYKKTTFGDVRFYDGRSVTDWDLRSGSVTRRALSAALKKALHL